MTKRKRTSRFGRSAGPPPNFVAVVSLGCPKNQVDTENLLGALSDRDVVFCPDPADASVIIVNTCGFIAPARDEGDEVLRECIALKRDIPSRKLVVAGCWVEREGDVLRRKYPQVDVWVGLLTPGRIRWIVERVLDDRRDDVPPAVCESPSAETHRLRATPAHYAYLRISEGCDNRCAYCTIPLIRGPLRSKPVEAVLEEARVLAAEGVREVNLVAQDTTEYGRDLYGERRIVPLIRDLARVDGIEWIRLLYAHPAHFTDELIDLIAEEPKVCRYVDLPIQHINDTVLESMDRKVTRRRIEELIAKLRERVDGIVLRTTVLVGFPGETEEAFEELTAFLKSVRFERLGAFEYSPEADTPARTMSGQVPPHEREMRFVTAMELQRDIAAAVARSWVGRELPVIVDEQGDEPGAFVGRTCGDAPDIDPVIFLTGTTEVGAITTARITGTDDYDLLGEV